jgi:phage terminase small subunit
MSTKLTKKQELFCQEYLIDLNATQAAIRSGYSKKTARNIGHENLTKPNIAAKVQAMADKRLEQSQANAKYVLDRLIGIDQMDILDILDDSLNLRPVSEWPNVWRISLSGLDMTKIGNADSETVLQKIKWPDKVKNLELLGKHIDIQAFRDQKDVNIGGSTVEMAARIIAGDMSLDEATRIYKQAVTTPGT